MRCKPFGLDPGHLSGFNRGLEGFESVPDFLNLFGDKAEPAWAVLSCVQTGLQYILLASSHSHSSDFFHPSRRKSPAERGLRFRSIAFTTEWRGMMLCTSRSHIKHWVGGA
jgi:hypothetical protein